MEALIKYLAEYMDEEIDSYLHTEIIQFHEIEEWVRQGIAAFESTHGRVVTTIQEKG